MESQKQKPGPEKRRYARVPMKLHANVKQARVSPELSLTNIFNKKAKIKNLSQGGLLLEYPGDAELTRLVGIINKTNLLNNESFELLLEISIPGSSMMLSINVVPVWAETIPASHGHAPVLFGVRYATGTNIEPVVFDDKLGLCFNIGEPAGEVLKPGIHAVGRIREVRKAKPVQSQDGARHYCRGVLFHSTGQYDLSLKEFSASIENGYDSADLRNKLGEIMFKQKEYARAAGEFKKALDLSPFHTQAKQNLIRIRKFFRA